MRLYFAISQLYSRKFENHTVLSNWPDFLIRCVEGINTRFVFLYFLLPILLALSIFVPDRADAQVRSIPIRWCIVEGAPAATNPEAVGEPDTDSVAWRRHERTSESTFIPQAEVTLRSSLWNIAESMS